jgi:hypothetical protein
MDKFTHKMRPPLKKKAKVSVADLMRRGAEKKRPLGSNREETHLMGSLGASQLQRIDARIRKTKAKLSDEQLDVVAKAREGTSCFITGSAVLHRRPSSKRESSAACFARDTCDVCRGQSRSESKQVMTAKTALVTKQTMKHAGHGQVLRAQGSYSSGEARRPPRLRDGLDGRGRHADRGPNDPRLRGRRPRR